MAFADADLRNPGTFANANLSGTTNVEVAPSDAGATTNAEAPTLSQNHALTIDDTGATTNSEAPTLTQDHALSAPDCGVEPGAGDHNFRETFRSVPAATQYYDGAVSGTDEGSWSAGGGTVDVEYFQRAAGGKLRGYTTGGDYSMYLIHGDGDFLCNSTYNRFRIRLTPKVAGSSGHYISILNDGATSQVCQLRLYETAGTRYFRAYPETAISGLWSVDTPMTIDLVVRWSNYTYDVYVDGVLRYNNISFLTAAGTYCDRVLLENQITTAEYDTIESFSLPALSQNHALGVPDTSGVIVDGGHETIWYENFETSDWLTARWTDVFRCSDTTADYSSYVGRSNANGGKDGSYAVVATNSPPNNVFVVRKNGLSKIARGATYWAYVIHDGNYLALAKFGSTKGVNYLTGGIGGDSDPDSPYQFRLSRFNSNGTTAYVNLSTLELTTGWYRYKYWIENWGTSATVYLRVYNEAGTLLASGSSTYDVTAHISDVYLKFHSPNTGIDRGFLDAVHFFTFPQLEQQISVPDAGVTTNAETPTVTEGGNVNVEPLDAGVATNSELPTLSQDHAVASGDHGVTVNSELPTLTQDHSLASGDHGSSSNAELPVLTINIETSSGDHGVTTNAELPSATETTNVTPLDAGPTTNAETPSVTVDRNLSVDDTGATTNSELPPLSQDHKLASGDHGSNSNAELPTLAQGHVLASSDHGVTTNAELPTASVTTNVEPSDAGANTNADLPSISIISNISIDDTGVTTGSELPTISQNHVLGSPDYGVTTNAELVVLIQNHPFSSDDRGVTTYSDLPVLDSFYFEPETIIVESPISREVSIESGDFERTMNLESGIELEVDLDSEPSQEINLESTIIENE